MIRAYIRDDQHGFGVSMFLVRETDDARHVLSLIGENLARWDLVEPMAEARPTFRLDAELARALADGLMDHYHHGEDSRALRQDYAAICERLDNLGTVVNSMAARLLGCTRAPAGRGVVAGG